MAYKRHKPATYLVCWGDLWKAGITSCERWRKFELRGAEVVQVTYFDSVHDALALEEDLLDGLAERGHRPFETKADARDYLGHDGGGWRECWCLCMRPHHASALQPRIATALSVVESDASMHVRTNALTHADASKTEELI